LNVFIAHQNDATNVVSILRDITAAVLYVLTVRMGERRIVSIKPF